MEFAVGFIRQFKKIFYSVCGLAILYFLVRIGFLISNHLQFPEITSLELLRIFARGLQQDVASIILINCIPFGLLFLSDVISSNRRYLMASGKWTFIILNAAALAINILDIAYFRFNRHRSNLDLWYVISDSMGSFRSIMISYWYLILFFLLGVYLIVKMARWLFHQARVLRISIGQIILNQLIFLLIPTFILFSSSGRFVLPSTPLLSVSPGNLPIAQNSFYTFAYSVLKQQHALVPTHYYSNTVLDSLVQSHHTITTAQPMQPKNVVIIILESFARGYLDPGSPIKAHTPFFDSLIKRSTYFPNAFANGASSNQGIVAILGGLPAFLDEPFYYSAYANTPLKSIGNILKKNGYNTNFFMGAGKDHFGFEKFGHMAGIDHFYNRSDFNDDHFYDGNWGIYDEPFLQYMAEVLDKKMAPFMAVVFTISSHPPFTIQPERREQFNDAKQTAAQNSISYVDQSFNRFFERCKHSAWFQNSIFIFCADHSFNFESYKSLGPEHFVEIPLFIYQPSQEVPVVDSNIISQVDITPTLLHLLNYSGGYFGFGVDAFDSAVQQHYSINKHGQIYQLIQGDLALGFDPITGQISYLYNYSLDPGLKVNLVNNSTYGPRKDQMERLLKANIQLYNNSLINRSLGQP